MAAHCEDMHPIDMALLNRYHLVKRGVFSEVRWVFRGRDGSEVHARVGNAHVFRVFSRRLGRKTRDRRVQCFARIHAPAFGRSSQMVQMPFMRTCLQSALRPRRISLPALRQAGVLDPESSIVRTRTDPSTEAAHARRGSGSLTEPFPPKPRFMHSKTYHRLEAVYARLAAISLSGLSAKLAKIRRP